MTMPRYKSDKSIMMAAWYKSRNDNNKFDNNEDKVCLLLRWKMSFGRSRVRLHARSQAGLHTKSHDCRFCDPGVIKELTLLFNITLTGFFLSMSSICQVVSKAFL